MHAGNSKRKAPQRAAHAAAGRSGTTVREDTHVMRHVRAGSAWGVQLHGTGKQALCSVMAGGGEGRPAAPQWVGAVWGCMLLAVLCLGPCSGRGAGACAAGALAAALPSCTPRAPKPRHGARPADPHVGDAAWPRAHGARPQHPARPHGSAAGGTHDHAQRLPCRCRVRRRAGCDSTCAAGFGRPARGEEQQQQLRAGIGAVQRCPG
jgi:hypothetical protein